MKVENLGAGRPEVAVVACVHGDEPCGFRAIERFKKNYEDLERPVKLVVANEEAFHRGERYMDKDLNRVFPGDSESKAYEKRLAPEILEELEGLKVLDLHSSESPKTPFAIISGFNQSSYDLATETGMEELVEISYVEGGMINYIESAVTVECGPDDSAESAKTAYKVMVNFLAAQDVIDESYESSEPEVFEVFDKAKGSGYEFTAENFLRVEKGEEFARKNGELRKAGETFYPVLMSTDGYDDMIGFKASKKQI